MLDHSSLCVCVYFNMYVIRASLLLTLYSVRGYMKNKTHTLCDRPGGAPAPPPRPGAAISRPLRKGRTLARKRWPWPKRDPSRQRRFLLLPRGVPLRPR